jgi:hypothetical protein
MMTA